MTADKILLHGNWRQKNKLNVIFILFQIVKAAR